MYKKTITYTDYEGQQRTEDFYFNLTKAEVTEMETGEEGGFAKMLHRIVATRNPSKLVAIFKDIILKAYGEKSPDGRQFIKNQALRDSFAQTEAYSDMFMSLATNADEAAAFVNGILPKMP